MKSFHLVFDTGIVSESWLLGDILPIYKTKADTTSPENYRPITLLSCLGKLFTSIINNRLTSFAEKYEVISYSQSGFRKGFSTTDNLFVIQSLIEMTKFQVKRNCTARLSTLNKRSITFGETDVLINNEINGKC